MSTESRRDSGKKFLKMAEMGEWTPIPYKLPISGKRGAEKLYRLRRRTQYLQRRINQGTFGRGNALNHARGELAATEWILKTFMMYEGLLKKGPPEESEEMPEPK
jgi:hypothetical protein